MGILGALKFAPFLLLSLFAGVWADRLRRRPILIVSDFGRGVLLALIPAAAVTGYLSIELLYCVALGTGVLTVFFDVTYQSYLPALVRREQLVEGNSKLQASASVAQIGGPGLAGVLVQSVGPATAVAVDAASFVASVISLLSIRAPEPAPDRPPFGRTSVWAELREGIAVVLENPLLRSIAGCTATSNLFGNALMALYVLYLTRELGISPAVLGLILSIGGPGALLGSLVAGPTAQRFGLGPTIVGSIALSGLSSLLVPLAGATGTATVGVLMLAAFVAGVTSPLYNINQVSLRQAITPHRVQGRMNASMRFVVWGTIPIGALLGGALGEAFGLQQTILAMAVGTLLAPLWVVFSPVRHLQRQPSPSPSA
jgi:MFS family permease